MTRFLILFSFLCSISVFGQQNLQCPITLRANSISIGEILKHIEAECNVSFSYLSEAIPTDSVVSCEMSNKSAQFVLLKVLGKGLITKQIGSTILLKQISTNKTPEKSIETVKIRGIITDKSTNQQLTDVTVFSSEDLKPVLTDSSGFFELEIPKRKRTILIVKRQEYLDTLVYVSSEKQNDDVQIIKLSRIPQLKLKIDSLRKEIDSLLVMKWFDKTAFQKHSKNLGGLILRKKSVQLSLVPGLSTNGQLNSANTSKVSLNLIGGYSGGISGIEIGALSNIVKRDMNGIQIAGVANIVGKNVNGLQSSGVAGITLGKVTGMQSSGIVSIARRGVRGWQSSGFLNIAGKQLYGFQASGFLNIASKITGAQFSTWGNLAYYDLTGIQITTILNIATNVKGAQFSSWANIAHRDLCGLQLGTMANIVSGKVIGGQVAGVFNYATKLHGFQFGLINVVADSVKGVPIGLLSIAPKGYLKSQLEYSSNNRLKLSVKTGVKSFYNIFSVGIEPGLNYNVGYGIGSIVPLNKYVSIGADITADQTGLSYLNMNGRLQGHLTLKFGKRLELYGAYNYETSIFGSDLIQNTQENIFIDSFKQGWSIGIRY